MTIQGFFTMKAGLRSNVLEIVAGHMLSYVHNLGAHTWLCLICDS